MTASRSCGQCRTWFSGPRSVTVCPVCGAVVPPPLEPTRVGTLPRTTHDYSPAGAVTTTNPVLPMLRLAPVLPPGSELSFSNYVLCERIGHGGMGVVYRAKRKDGGGEVALKVIQSIALSDPHYRARFQAEARALSRVVHPNVVQMIEADEENGLPFIAMEYVADGTLAAKLKKGPPLPPREAAKLICGVARAVQALHDEGVIHRDVKPSNILLGGAGEGKLADFGLAKLRDASRDLTMTGAVVGTPQYMAPEQASATGAAAIPQTDVYALGGTLYFALTGNPPFGDLRADGTLPRDPFSAPGPRDKSGDVPPDLDAVVRRCLSFRPENRYATAGEFADDLERFLRSERTNAQPETTAGKGAKWVWRHRRGIAAAAAMLAVGGVIGAAVMMVPAKKVVSSDAVTEYQRDDGSDSSADLMAGREVVLVGKPGQPVPKPKWVVGRSLRGDSFLDDGTFGIEARGNCMLEMCPDTVTDRYTITAEMRHVRAHSSASLVGLYFGAGLPTHAPNGFRAQRTWAITFNDCLPPKDVQVAPAKDTVELVELLMVRLSKLPWTNSQVAESHPIRPSASPTDGWREIELTVRPSGIGVKWRSGSDKWEQLIESHAEDWSIPPREWWLQPDGRSPVVPVRVTRGSLGLLVNQAAVSVRHMKVRPIP